MSNFNEILSKFQPSQLIDELNSKDVFIYGNGQTANNVKELLNKKGVAVKDTFDMCQHRVDTTCDIDKSNSTVIISFIRSVPEVEAIKEWLNRIGFNRIISFYEVYNSLVIQNEIEAIKSAYVAMSDDESRAVFESFFIASFWQDSSLCHRPTAEEQYLVDGLGIDYSYYVDCGAGCGETLKAISNKKTVKKAVLFEPDLANYKKLMDYVNGAGIEDIFTYPCLVGDKTEVLRFDMKGTSASVVSESGQPVLSFALDKIISGSPTFIKMDIEGMEEKALNGCTGIIVGHAPSFAVSCYHKFEDMWRLTNQLKSLNSKYKIYLRSHYILGAERVLYAVQS